MDCSRGMLWLCVGTFSSQEAAAPRLPVFPRVEAMRFNWEEWLVLFGCRLSSVCSMGNAGCWITQRLTRLLRAVPRCLGREGCSPLGWGRSKPRSSHPSLCWREEWVLSWTGPREEISVLWIIPCVNSSALSVHSSVLAGGPPILAGGNPGCLWMIQSRDRRVLSLSAALQRCHGAPAHLQHSHTASPAPSTSALREGNGICLSEGDVLLLDGVGAGGAHLHAAPGSGCCRMH